MILESEIKFKETLEKSRSGQRQKEMQDAEKSIAYLTSGLSKNIGNSIQNEEHREAEASKAAASSLYKSIRGPKWQAPIRSIGLGFKMRKAARKGLKTPWILAFAFALACDLVDFMPIIGWIISWIIRPFLFVFLWRTGKWKVKLLRAGLIFFEIIPAINMIPWTTIAVYHAYRGTKKELKKEKKEKEQAQEIQRQTPAYADGYNDYPLQEAA